MNILMILMIMSTLSMCWWRKNIILMLLSLEMLIISLFTSMMLMMYIMSISFLLIMLAMMVSGSTLGLSLLVSISHLHMSSNSYYINILTYGTNYSSITNYINNNKFTKFSIYFHNNYIFNIYHHSNNT